MQFRWNLQLLNSLLSFFRNLPSSTINLWRLKLTEFLCLTGSSILLVFFTKLSFILFTVRRFFLLIHFLVREDYELPKSLSHVLSVLSWSISSCSTLIASQMMLCVRLFSELMILPWDEKPSASSQQVEIPYQL